jgi:hypothetical protein
MTIVLPHPGAIIFITIHKANWICESITVHPKSFTINPLHHLRGFLCKKYTENRLFWFWNKMEICIRLEKGKTPWKLGFIKSFLMQFMRLQRDILTCIKFKKMCIQHSQKHYDLSTRWIINILPFITQQLSFSIYIHKFVQFHKKAFNAWQILY